MNCLFLFIDSRLRGMMVFTIFLLIFCVLPNATKAGQPLLTAETISFDDQTDTITAIGNVELAEKDHVLRANKITYNKNTDVAKAEGKIAILSQKTGEIMYAKELELTSDMKQIFMKEVGILFPDNSRIVALNAQRYEGRYLVAEHGIYSACDLCKKNPRKAPIWQISAVRTTHDSEKKDIIYRNATIDFWGIPIFYTPYFSHPDPTVSRRQGFLTPNVGMDSTLGAMARIPYYFDIAPNSDLLLTPTISEKDYLQTNALWRHKFKKGNLHVEGSLAYAHYKDDTGNAMGKKWRGHLFGNTRFNINKKWRLGGEVAYASDKGYMNRYNITGEDLLVNRFYAERFKGRNYFVSDMYYFQDMRPGTRLAEPLIAPALRYNAYGEPNKAWGGRWSFNSSLLVTSRPDETDIAKQGPSTRRLALKTGWERQIISQSGFLTTLSGQIRADTYYADNVSDGNTVEDIKRFRPFAQADVQIRYPMGRRSQGYEQILEPIALLSIAPNVNNNRRLPNEDSLDVEFDETNLFSTNRFSGIDRVEGGTRAAYGLRHALFGHNGERIEMLVGQVFRFQEDSTFTEGSGLRDKFSDFVGHIDFSPAEWLNMSYGFRLNQKDLSITRQELQASLGVPKFMSKVQYLSLKQSEGSSTVDQRIQEATMNLSSNFAKYWSASASHKRAFAPMPGPRNTSFNLTYQDECFRSNLSISRDYTNQVDVDPGMSILLTVYLKNIGGVNTDY